MKKLWIWKNFVNGNPEYWVFDNPFPCDDSGGDPMTLGEPCGYAVFKESVPRRTDISELEVIDRIKRARGVNNLYPTLGKQDCWQSVTNANETLTKYKPTEELC